MELHESIWREVAANAEKAFAANFNSFPEKLAASRPEFNLLLEWHKKSLLSAVPSDLSPRHIKRYLRMHLRKLIKQHFAELLADLKTQVQVSPEQEQVEQYLAELSAGIKARAQARQEQKQAEQYFAELKARAHTRQEQEQVEQSQKLFDEVRNAKRSLEFLRSRIDKDCHTQDVWYQRGYPEMQQDRPLYKYYWRGAGIIICSPQSGEEEYTGYKDLCVTPHAKALSALCVAMFRRSNECLDHISKYSFFGSIAESINTEKPDTEKDTLLCAVRAALEVLKELQTAVLNFYR